MTTARDIREFARNEGMTVGNRGRLAPEVKIAYFAAHPAEARALAAERGVEISAKGKISEDALSALSRTIA